MGSYDAMKLTLNVDQNVAERARRLAKRRGISLSKMVEGYLAAVTEPAGAPATMDTPVLRSLRGSLRSAEVDGYRKHLVAKYIH